MKISTTYDRVLALFPDATAEITESLVKGLKKSKSAKKDPNPQNWDWSYEAAKRVQGFTFAQVLDGTASSKKPREYANVAEQVFLELSDGTLMVHLTAAQGKMYRTAPLYSKNAQPHVVPSELVKYFSGPELPCGQGNVFVAVHENGQWVNKEHLLVGLLTKTNALNELYAVLLTQDYSGGIFKVDSSKNELIVEQLIYSTVSFNKFFGEEPLKEGQVYFINKSEYLATTDISKINLFKATTWHENAAALVKKLYGELTKSPGFMAIGHFDNVAEYAETLNMPEIRFKPVLTKEVLEQYGVR